MNHVSIKLDTPCEFINITSINPLISKCYIKVCYVGNYPNRNNSVITKETAKKIANSLPGSPIVGFFNDETGDFEEHNRIIDISEGKLEMKDSTKPYGFVDLNAKCWFQKFSDDGVEHEYLCTEGWLWTGQYPECQRIIDFGNNQSMELDDRNLNGSWAKDINGKAKFFIINEAIIKNLCILGEEYEPCFEGAQIASMRFSFDNDFNNKLYSMMKELQELLKKGGSSVYTKYSMTIGSPEWISLYSYIQTKYPMENDAYCSKYSIEGIYEEDSKTFAVLKDNEVYYRLNFSFSEANEFEATDLVELVDFAVDETPQFDENELNSFIAEYKTKKEEEESGKTDKNNSGKNDNKTEGSSKNDEETCPDCGKPISECTCEKKKNYNLEEIPEYTELQNNYAQLNTEYASLKQNFETMQSELQVLKQFKQGIELKEKEDMISNFYMLSDEDKADVIKNINTYSLDEIEAKLSVICVRNKVSFDDNQNQNKNPITYNLSNSQGNEEVPEWVKAAESVAKRMN